MTPYELRFDVRAVRDGRSLPLPLRRRILVQLDLLSASPYRDHPGVHVRPTREVDGVWHFHAGKDVRVHYTTEGDTLWVLLIERSTGVTRRTTVELRRRSSRPS